MPSPKGDPTYIKNRERFFMDVAKTIAKASSHPEFPGGCVLARDREIIGDGRNILTASKIEVDCLSHAIATAAKRGTPTPGSEVFSTRYPFSPGVFQCYVMGIRRIVVLAHEWEPRFRDEFRRAARLARELSIAIETIYDNIDPQLTKAYEDENYEQEYNKKIETPFAPDEFDTPDPGEFNVSKPTTI